MVSGTSLKSISAVLPILGRLILPGGPDQQTFDRLRSDYSHEPASQIACLSAFFLEWEQGRFQEQDPSQCRTLIRELRTVFLMQTRQATLGWDTLGDLLDLQVGLGKLQRLCEYSCPEHAGEALRSGERRAVLARVQWTAQRLAERLSRRHAVPLRELVEEVIQSHLKESGPHARTNPVEYTRDPVCPTLWVPRSQVAGLRDVLRNVLRNAREATRSKHGSDGRIPWEVQVHLGPAPDGHRVCLIVRDQGPGLPGGNQDQLWGTGVSHKGEGRGQGLTLQKLAFVRRIGSCMMTNRPEGGAEFRFDFEQESIGIPSPPCWKMRHFQALLLVVVMIGTLGLHQAFGPVRATRIEGEKGKPQILGYGPKDIVAWEVELPRNLMPNRPHALDLDEPLAVREHPRGQGILDALVGTEPDSGRGKLVVIDGLGFISHSVDMDWPHWDGVIPPNLISSWQSPLNGFEEADLSYVCEIRNGRRSLSSIQFLDRFGNTQGAYYHDGMLRYGGQGDFDGDGELELLLFGNNNAAWRDTALVRCEEETWFACILLLEPRADFGRSTFLPEVGGPTFREDAYLLVPPIGNLDHLVVTGLEIFENYDGTPQNISLLLGDGRYIITDPLLNPQYLTIGDRTPAEALNRAQRLPPLRVQYLFGSETKVVSVSKGQTK